MLLIYAARLRVENVDGDLLRVIPAKTEGRKRVELVIPLQPEPLAVVERLVHVADDGYLFPRLYDASLTKCLRIAFGRAGVKSNTLGHASFHSLRATFISAMDDAGVPQAVTDAITGHAPVDMHGRYSQPGRDVLMKAVKRAVKPLCL